MKSDSKLLTICTAAYNAGPYIRDFFESILSCREKDCLEVIVVNDGSNDDTKSIAEAYVNRYPGIITLINKGNGGSGSARNVAFHLAAGKYIKLIDADDYVVSRNFDRYLEKLRALDVDMVLNGYYRRYEKQGREESVDPAGEVFHEGHVYDLSVENIAIPMDFAMPGVTYRTSLFQENDIRLTEGISFVDMEYLMLPIPYVLTVAYMDAPFYTHRLELSGQSVDPAALPKKEPQFRRVVESLLSYYESQDSVFPNHRAIMKRIAARTCLGLYYTIVIRNDLGLKRRMEDYDRWIKGCSYDVWLEMQNISGSVRLLRKMNYWGYYPMMLYSICRKYYHR